MSESDNLQIASNYMLNFQSNVLQLTTTFSQLVVLNRKYFVSLQKMPQDAYTGLEDADKTNYATILESAIFLLEQVHVMLESLKTDKALNFDEKLYTELVETHKTLSQQYLLDEAVLRLYIQALHKLIIKSVIRDLLKTSQEYYANIYQSSKQQTG